jgi:hypothetical protein
MEPSLGLGSCHGHRNCFRCAVRILAPKLVFQRRAKRAGDYGRSVVLLALSVVGLVEGVPFGFGWFLVALAITLYAVKKIAPRMLGQER